MQQETQQQEKIDMAEKIFRSVLDKMAKGEKVHQSLKDTVFSRLVYGIKKGLETNDAHKVNYYLQRAMLFLSQNGMLKQDRIEEVNNWLLAIGSKQLLGEGDSV